VTPEGDWLLVERLIINFVKRIPACSHVAILYNTSYDRWSILSSLIKRNLEKKQSVIYFSNGPRDPVAAGLHEVDAALAKMQRSCRLSIIDSERWYLEEESLRETQIYQTWMEAVKDTLSEGFEGLCVICEPTNILGSDLPRVLDYEKSLPRRFPLPLSVICQYSVEELLSLEDGNLLMKLADAHAHVITPSFIGTRGFSAQYRQSLARSLESILGKTATSVFFSSVKAKQRDCRGNQTGLVYGLDEYLDEIFSENVSKVIRERILKEQYERVGLKFKSLI